MAVAFAAAELLSRKALELDLVLLIEGEEECGSRGFMDAVSKHKVRSCFSRRCLRRSDQSPTPGSHW
jgi:hypothetical protein